MENNKTETMKVKFTKPENDGKKCVFCGEPFSDKNVFTPLGWRETEISGMCEKCWDNTFADCEE